MANRPPLNALHVFCTVAQEGGFRQAAESLHITASAVSKQIQVLEDHLKEVLFERNAGNAVTLTPAGLRLYERVAEKMAAINEALNGDRHAARHTSILVDTSITLAMHWLIPRLSLFREREPHLQVQVRTGDGDINPAAAVDVFIRRDVAELRGLSAQTFMTEHAVLVGSPQLALQSKEEDMRWLERTPRIATRSRPDLWRKWGAAHHLDKQLIESATEFDNTVLAIQAAIQGLGVLVVPEIFVMAMLREGTLQRMDETRVVTGSYSFAIARQNDSMRVAAFTDWLRERGMMESGET